MVAEALVNYWICHYRVLLELHSELRIEIFRKVCEHLGVRKTRTSLLHLQSNGMV